MSRVDTRQPPDRRGAFSVTWLQQRLRELCTPLRGARLCVAYSGGADSTALLAALARLRSRCGFSLRALHVNHQLHADATRWAAQAVATAGELSVPAQVLCVDFATAGLSVEAAAREARYAAMAAQLAPGEALLTAHHEEDQLETVLLQLLRGAGLAGLAAMPGRARFGPGWLLRPLLDQSRAALRDWVAAEGLDWVEDPSNVDPRFDRNYLRAEIVPRLLARWPAAARTAARSARHLAEAGRLLTAVAGAWQDQAVDGTALRASYLRALSPAGRHLLLRHWLQARGLSAPDTVQLEAALTAMLDTRVDGNPMASWRGGELRRHGDRILAIPLPGAAGSTSQAVPLHWSWRQCNSIDVPGSGRLWLQSHVLGALALDRLPPQLQIRFRSGGERLESATGHKTLKNLLQELDIAPWRRARLPLLCYRGKLLAVADCWLHPSLRASARARRRAHLHFEPEN